MPLLFSAVEALRDCGRQRPAQGADPLLPSAELFQLLARPAIALKTRPRSLGLTPCSPATPSPGAALSPHSLSESEARARAVAVAHLALFALEAVLATDRGRRPPASDSCCGALRISPHTQLGNMPKDIPDLPSTQARFPSLLLFKLGSIVAVAESPVGVPADRKIGRCLSEPCPTVPCPAPSLP